MDNLIEKIDTRINELYNYEFEDENELTLLKNFYENANLNLKNIQHIHLFRNSYFLAATIAANKIKTFEEIDELITPLEKIIDKLPTDSVVCYLFLKMIRMIIELGKEDFKKRKCDVPPFDNDEFINFVDEINNIDIFDCLTTFMSIRGNCKEINELLGKKDEKYKLLLQQLNQKDSYKKLYQYSFEMSKKRISELNKEKCEKINKNNKLIKLYNKIKLDLQSNKIIEYNDYFDDVENDIKYELQRVILKHNEPFYINISNQIARLNNNLDTIFNINGYDINLVSKENQIRLMNNGNIENIKNVLPLLKVKPFLINEQSNFFTEILLCTNEKILNNIKDLYEKGIIDMNFIYYNLSILLSSSYKSLTNINCSYEIFINNLNLLKSKHFNLKNIRKSNPKLFLINENLLKQRLLSFNQYDIKFENQENINYEYITNDKIFSIIDQFIELGLHNYVKDNIETMVKNSDEIIKRIYISSIINLNIWNENNKLNNSIMTGYNYPIKNEDLDNYIVNTTSNYIDNSLIKYFNNEEFNYTNLINTIDNNFLNGKNYLFDDIIISRNKVIRNISSISSNIEINENNIKNILITCIIYNSILDNDQIETIKNEIDNLLQAKRKRYQL